MNPFECRQGRHVLDFPALDEVGKLVRNKVRLAAIIGFGVEHVPVFTAQGTFTRWESWGYLLTKLRRYRVSVRLIRHWQRAWRWELHGKQTRYGVRRAGLGSILRVVDWDFRVTATHRRGGSWPRRRRHILPPVPAEAKWVICQEK